MAVIMNELVIEANIANMNEVLNFVNGQLDGCSPKIRNQIAVSVDEIFSNIARYAYHPGSGSAVVRITVGDDVVTIEFEDSGVAYDPLSTDTPDTTLPAEEREIGGLGIFIVKNIMDSVRYRRNGNKNIITIKKKLA